MEIKFTANRRGNYTSNVGHLTIYRPVKGRKNWLLTSGSARQRTIGTVLTLKAAKEMANKISIF